jgi:hypothetical protein
MGSINANPSEVAPVVATIPPQDAGTNTTRTSDYVFAGDYDAFAAIAQQGTVDAATVVRVLRASSSTGGTTASVVTASLGTNANAEAYVNVDRQDGDGDTYPYIAVQLEPGSTNTNNVSAVMVGLEPRYAPGTNLSSVTVATA